ncbi:MAG: phenylalanine aminomutase (D-beta-phenylalanine forming), partial [Silvanigrellaceae bacterium]|nr:phenylalanine aminomutase (D-beta-phenylalanine forming) [Silvanigrellaceae bacterium]
VRKNITDSRSLLESFVDEKRVIYGVNTSLGGFVNILVPVEFAEQLQNNLINSVATNVGEYFDDSIVRAIMLTRIISLSKGVSAISLENFFIFTEMFNNEIYPLIPKKGSLGASGDLGPLACIALAATGQGNVRVKGEIVNSKEALNHFNIKPMSLSYKEGLAMINGTSAMTGLAALNWYQCDRLMNIYEFISCLTFEGLATKQKPFDPRVHKRKMHLGQLKTAQKITKILESSHLITNEKSEEINIQNENDGTIKNLGRQIEDAYSLRCTPQILGPILDTLIYVKNIVENELNSSSDNPVVIPEENEVFHNGHFHGQYIAMAMDYLSIAMTTLSNLSDRRIDRFMDKNNSNGLPAFLCSNNQGLRLGLMGGQFMATSITAENRSLCVPLSIQTLTSTGDFQDIVSFGLIAARRCQEIYDNTCYIIAFEGLCAAQAVDIRQGKMSDFTQIVYSKIRKIIPFLTHDISITPYIEQIKLALQDIDFSNHLEEKLNHALNY